MILNQGRLLEAFSTAGLEGWLGTAKPKGDTIRLITTSSHVLPMCICPPKKLLEMSAPLLHVSCTWIGLPPSDCVSLVVKRADHCLYGEDKENKESHIQSPIFGNAIFNSTMKISVDTHMDMNFQGCDCYLC
ncbi:unnamed protein product, partial [Fusarium equiseti]